MDMIAKGKRALGGRIAKVKEAGPGLVLSAASIVENTTIGTTVGVAVPVNASNPGPVSIVSQTLANGIAMTGDGISFAVGAAGGPTGTLNYEATPSFSVTFEYTDDNGTYQVVRNFTITDVADGPTIAGATTDLETMLGAPQVGVETSGDLDDLFVSPTSQTLTYTVSHGSIGVGNAWTWTPSTEGATTVSVTATDEDGQTLQIDFTVDVLPAAEVNNAPTAGNITLEFLVPPPAVGAPDAFTAGQWSVADDGTNGDATITITTLPADNGSAITALEYRLNGGAAVSLGGTTTGAYGISGLTDGVSTNVQVRAVNANGSGGWSDTKSVTSTGIPSAFTAGLWTLTDLTTGGDARIAVSSLPSANGAALTDLEAKVGAGAWTSLGGATTGNYDLLDAFTDGVSTNVLIRAVNANGSGADSDTKSVTTTAPASGITGYDAPQKLIDSSASSGPYTGTYIGRQAGEDIVIFVGFLNENSSSAGDPANWTVTLDGQTLTPIDTDAVTLIYCCGALYRASPSNTGDLALSVTTGGSGRACFAIAWPIAGAGATASANTAKNESNSQALTQPNGITTTADNNVILSVCAVKGGDITGLAVSGADGSSTDNTGTNATNDLTFGWAWLKKATAGSVSLAWTWTGSDASWGGYIELPEA